MKPQNLNVIIIDDEQNARLALRGIITENFPELHIVDECNDVPTAVKAIMKHRPELIFLDISMPGYSGIELFKFIDLSELKVKVIFVTAYSEYAINAFELSAVDYILKPVRIDALRRAISKVLEKSEDHVHVLHENMTQAHSQKMALQTGEGLMIIPLSDIIYLKADGSYTHFILQSDKKITVTKKIADFARLEQMGAFLRIHRSHMINLDKVSKILKIDGGLVVMENGDQLSISTDKKQDLMSLFENRL